jgi:hypothetical protein
MPFRRRSVKSAKTVRALSQAIEPLEKRTMLTALVNGTFQGTGTAFDGTSIFEFRQGFTNTTVRISVVGNITAEFIGGFVDAANPSVNPITLTDLVVAGTPTNTDPRGVFLFSIYVVKADMNSAISIAQINNNGRMQPFTGTNNINGAGQFNQGGAYLGARTAPGNGGDVAFIQADRKNFGMRPRSAGELFAGLQVATGNNLGKFYFGGTVTGLVDVAGSMDQFYAGNLVTGNPTGVGGGGVIDFVTQPQLLRNFHIGGDIRNVTIGSQVGTNAVPAVGTTLTYKSDVRIDIGGRLGEIYSAGDMILSMKVHNDSRNRGPGTPVRESEYIGATLTPNTTPISYFDPQYWGYDISLAELQPDARFTNDSLDTAQFLGTPRAHALKDANTIQVYGQMGPTGGDPIDYYAVALLGGQTIDLELLDRSESLTNNPLHIGIIDPEGRLLASDYVKVNVFAGLSNRHRLRFTAPRPGAYRVAVANDGDTTFTGGGVLAAGFQYELRIAGAGDLAVGGVRSSGQIGTLDNLDTGIDVLRGDLGGVQAGGNLFSQSLPWRVTRGNLRSMEAGSIGIDNITQTNVLDNTNIAYGSGIDFEVAGSVGVLRNTSNTGMLAVDDDANYPTSLSALSSVTRSMAVGKNIQLVDAAGTLEGSLLANGSIGVIRALQIGWNSTLFGPGPVFMADVDRSGNDGIIDLIDVVGDTDGASIDFNGPAISTGPGGNVRYMSISTNVQARRDPFFGGGTPEETLYDPGEKARLTDDSGTQFILTPTPLEGQPAGSTSGNLLFDPPQLTVLTYPIRGKSGVVVTRVTVTPLDDTTDGVVAAGGGGLLVETGAKGSSGSVEIGEVNVGGNAGNTFTFDPINRVYTLAAVPAPPTLPIRDVNIILTGDSRVDVWNVQATGTVNSINNRTVGEIVNISGIPDVYSIEGETIGLAESHAGTVVEGFTVRNNTYPFINQKSLIEVEDVAFIRARRGIGNVFALNIGDVVADSNNKDVRGVFEGINGPIVAFDPGAPNQLTGNIGSVDIGEGVSFGGSGGVGLSGIYAEGLIDRITGENADIRGNIVATGDTVRVTQQAVDPVTGAGLTNPDGTPLMVSTPTYVIGSIELENGSIVQGNILTTPFADALVGDTDLTFLEQADTYNTPFFDIGAINIENGGIIGSTIFASDIGLVKIENGFGVFSSIFAQGGDGVFQGIDTDGFGLRDVFLLGGSGLRLLNARGNGRLVPTNAYRASLRFSEKGQFDPYSGELLDIYNDLHKYLGTSTRRGKSTSLSGTGIIQDVTAIGARDLGKVEAQRISARRIFFVDPLTGTRTRVAYDDPAYPMQFNYANSTNSITVRDNIDGLHLSGGTVNKITAGKDIIRSLIEVSGELKSVTASQLRSSAAFLVEGSDGAIGSISTKHNMFSTINASQGIDRITVGGDIGAKRIQAGGNMGELTVNGSILTGTTVRVGRTLDELFIGRDLKANATVRAKAINEQTVNGQIIGDIIIA